jgi:hypothetical protein
MNPIIFSSLVFIVIRPLSTRAGRSILCDEQIKATIKVSPSNQTRYFWRDVAVPQVLPTVISGEKPCGSPPENLPRICICGLFWHGPEKMDG